MGHPCRQSTNGSQLFRRSKAVFQPFKLRSVAYNHHVITLCSRFQGQGAYFQLGIGGAYLLPAGRALEGGTVQHTTCHGVWQGRYGLAQ